MNSFYFILGLFAFWSIFLSLIFRFEKRQAWPYSELQGSPHFDDPTFYGPQHVSQALRTGYKLLGFARDTKGENYKTTYGMFVSPDRTTFAVVGWGTVMNMRVSTTWIHTPTADGRSFYSTDKPVGVQIDLSRNWTNQLAPVATFEELANRHASWFREHQAAPLGFAEGREYEQFRQVREEHFRSMERSGLINFVHGAPNDFHYTWSAAARTAMTGYFLGMLRQITGGKFPREL